MKPNLNRYLAGLTISQGRHAGQPLTRCWRGSGSSCAVRVCPWHVTDAALAVARGNGKSVLVAGIACRCSLDGPLVQPTRRGDCCRVEFLRTQARITV